MSDVGERLARLTARPDEEIDLAQAALLLARDEYPELEIDRYLARLDALAAACCASVPDAADAADRVQHLNRFLFAECGFRGNQDDYYDPRNSFLNEVLDRRIGIPITLSLVYTEVARRVGLAMVGIGFPGHFLVRHDGEPDVLIDPFAGGILSYEECERQWRDRTGTSARLDRSLLRPAGPREILVRMLRNLKHIYVQREDLHRALRTSDRIIALAPQEADEIRDRGALYLKLECFAAALGDFERYLELAPDGEAARTIRSVLPSLSRQVARLQ